MVMILLCVRIKLLTLDWKLVIAGHLLHWVWLSVSADTHLYLYAMG